MSLVPRNRQRAVANAVTGAALLSNPDVRNAVVSAGRRARSIYNSYMSRPGPAPQAPRRARLQRKLASRSSGPSAAKTNRQQPPHNKQQQHTMSRTTDGINKSYSYKRPASSKPYRTGFCREKVMDIRGSTGFGIAAELVVNPANMALFPLGANMASMHEQYEVRGGYIRMCYETESYTAVTSSTTAGVVVMGTNIDTTDPDPQTIDEAENQYGMSRCPPYADRCVHNIPTTHTALKTLYNNFSSNSLAPAGDSTSSKFYDLGVFRLCTSSQPNTNVIGELWVEYDITLIRRKQPGPKGYMNRYLHLSESPNGTASATNLGGTSGFALYSESTSNIPYTTSGNSITINETGRFLATFAVINTSGTTNAPTFTCGADIFVVNIFQDQTANTYSSFVTQGGTIQYVLEIFTLNGIASRRTIIIGGATGTTNGKSDFMLMGIGTGVNYVDHTKVQRPLRQPAIELDAASERLLHTEKRLLELARHVETQARRQMERTEQLEIKHDEERWIHTEPPLHAHTSTPTQDKPRATFFFPK